MGQGLVPQLFVDGGPLVLSVEKFFPVLSGLVPRDEFVERGDVEDDTIVEVGSVAARTFAGKLLTPAAGREATAPEGPKCDILELFHELSREYVL